MSNLNQKIHDSVLDGIRAIEQLKNEENLVFIEKCSRMIADCFKKGGKLLIAGNGGSMCDAMHFAEELSGQFRETRPAMAAIALSDIGHMSCVANDMGFEKVFARGIEALGKPEDIFIGLTTSGNSKNIIEAVHSAKKRNMQTIAFLGKTGGSLKGVCDLEMIIHGFKYSDRVQEAHMTAIHIIIELVEELVLEATKNIQELSICHAP